jgi:dihydrofolate synthase / folylpolyglutamate synthase
LPLLGEHQRMNAALALATVRALQPEVAVPDEAISAGLLKVDWAGRLQLVKAASGQTFLLDGAHNPAGAYSLKAAFQKFFPGVKPALILGILRDKDWKTMCETLAPLAGHIVIAPVHCDRSAPPEALREACHKVNPSAKVTACSSLVEALTLSAEDPFVVVAGSLYLIGELMEMLKWSPCLRPNERGLNEWSAPSIVSSPCCSPA